MINLDNLKDNLKKARVMANITQVKVAEELNVKQSTVSSWEKGTTSPTLENLVKLCDLYSVSADYLLGVDYEKKTITYKDLYLYLNGLDHVEYSIKLVPGNYNEGITPYSEFRVYSNNIKVFKFLETYGKIRDLKDQGNITQDMFDMFLHSAIEDIDFEISLDSEKNPQLAYSSEDLPF